MDLISPNTYCSVKETPKSNPATATPIQKAITIANILNTIPKAPPASVAFSPPIVPTTLFATIVIIAIEICVIKLDIPNFNNLPNTPPLILNISLLIFISFGFLK
ncbi:MAG: hypothetical protein J6A89_05945 [Clostridia bacterium]|nr:hypothetical protein [Clostridia bacterium]